MLATTATQINCVTGTNGDSPTNITKTDIDKVVATLLGNSGHMFMDNIEGDLKFNTSPIRPSYIALAHTDLTTDLNNTQNFVSSSQYTNNSRVLDGEWGNVDNMRFLVSQFGSVAPNASALGNNVYNVFCCAKESYACVDQEGATPIFIYRPAVYSGPLAQNVTVGYKFAQVPRLLNDAWLANLRCTKLN
jgi:N4-gp56 family major capsid protein